MTVPVGHVRKFDLEQYESRNFGRKFDFSKIRIEPVMLNFLAETKNLRNRKSEHPAYNRGKVLEKAAGNCYSQFPDTKQTRVEPSYPEIGERVITEGEYIYSS